MNSMKSHRSIDSIWEMDDRVIVPDFCCNGTLYFNNNLKTFIIGGDAKGFRGYLTEKDLIDLNYGDGIYKFQYENLRQDLYLWKISNSKIEKSGCIVNYNGCHDFILFLYNEGENVCEYNLKMDIQSKNIKRDFKYYSLQKRSFEANDNDVELIKESYFDFFGCEI
jgi:hypothetical protein